MIKVLLIIFSIISIHILCGIICINRLIGQAQYYTIVDFLVLSLFGPLLILVWAISECYCWFLVQITKIKNNERRRIKKQS
jgi:hypothetical protein